jgi:hypothetical protein
MLTPIQQIAAIFSGLSDDQKTKLWVATAPLRPPLLTTWLTSNLSSTPT